MFREEGAFGCPLYVGGRFACLENRRPGGPGRRGLWIHMGVEQRSRERALDRPRTGSGASGGPAGFRSRCAGGRGRRELGAHACRGGQGHACWSSGGWTTRPKWLTTAGSGTANGTAARFLRNIAFRNSMTRSPFGRSGWTAGSAAGTGGGLSARARDPGRPRPSDGKRTAFLVEVILRADPLRRVPWLLPPLRGMAPDVASAWRGFRAVRCWRKV